FEQRVGGMDVQVDEAWIRHEAPRISGPWCGWRVALSTAPPGQCTRHPQGVAHRLPGSGKTRPSTQSVAITCAQIAITARNRVNEARAAASSIIVRNGMA